MSYSATVYKIMIASPSDVTEERQIIREVISDWNIVHSESRQTVLLPVGWETHSYPEMGEHPQTLLNKQILRDCDLLVGVFWTRIGTATANYQSGSVEEIEEHLKANKPALLYFSNALVNPERLIPEQYEQLKQFKKSCQSRGLYHTYSDIQQFKESFSRHLQLHLNKFISNKSQNLTEFNSIRLTSTELSPEAQKLLKECSKSKDGKIFCSKYIGREFVLETNDVNLVEKEDSPRMIASWRTALKQLESNGFIEAQSEKRDVFAITSDGFKVADLITWNV